MKPVKTVIMNSKYAGEFKIASGIKVGEKYKKHQVLGIITNNLPNLPFREVLCPANCKIVALCDDYAQLNEGDMIAQIEIIPD